MDNVCLGKKNGSKFIRVSFWNIEIDGGRADFEFLDGKCPIRNDNIS